MNTAPEAEIEIYATKIAALIGHLSESEFNAVLDRAKAIARQRKIEAVADAGLLRLLRQ